MNIEQVKASAESEAEEDRRAFAEALAWLRDPTAQEKLSREETAFFDWLKTQPPETPVAAKK